jgi:hypothetical protein
MAKHPDINLGVRAFVDRPLVKLRNSTGKIWGFSLLECRYCDILSTTTPRVDIEFYWIQVMST